MALIQEFVPLELAKLHREAAVLKTEGWRFIQTHAVNTDDGVDLYYSFMKDGRAVNYRVAGVKNEPVPSITDLFLAAFVFENEARELFGVDMRDIAIDFAGAMYAPAESAPMTFISPEQKAAREKAKKAAANAAKEASPEAAASSEGGREHAEPARKAFVMTPERQARLDAKLATMSPEKVAKVQAALKAREAEAAASASQPAQPANGPADNAASATAGEAAAPANKGEDAPKDSADAPAAPRDTALDAALSLMDGGKADKVRAALEGRASGVAPESPASEKPPAAKFADEQLDSLIGLMDDDKAAIVRAALETKGVE